jgi:hypothetical protein
MAKFTLSTISPTIGVPNYVAGIVFHHSSSLFKHGRGFEFTFFKSLTPVKEVNLINFNLLSIERDLYECWSLSLFRLLSLTLFRPSVIEYIYYLAIVVSGE